MVRHLKAIAHAVDGLDIRAGIGKFFPKLLHKGIHGADISLIVEAPDRVENDLPGQHEIPVLNEIEEKSKFLRGEI